MGRRPRRGIVFSGWNTDIFENDTKIDELIDAQGWYGFAVYFYLCQKAYASDGYFYRWSYANAATTARRMGGGIGSETVKATVGTCLQIGLFDKRLFDTEGILTSRGIQRGYVEATLKRSYRGVNKDYWLLKEEESKGVFFVPENADFLPENADFLPENNPNSRVDKSIYFSSNPTLDEAFKKYLSLKEKPYTGHVIELAKKQLMDAAHGDEELAIKIINKTLEKGWSGFYEIKESKKKEKPAKKNKFCNFTESGRDFNAIAEEIMRTQAPIGRKEPLE